MFTNLTAQLENDPRYILKKVLKEAEDMGYEFNVGPECKSFILTITETQQQSAEKATQRFGTNRLRRKCP